MAAIPIHHAMIAIMQKDNVASAHATQSLGYALGWLRLPISRPSRPHYHSSIAPFSDDAGKQWAPKAKRRTHPPRLFARRGLDCIIAAIQLFGNSCR
ncbi:MAG TPA: hypothetical protein VN788_13925 [Verrucomicrobiae bacterium]|nr:hypothetical protein [Verrucomicrobiae bacterium]